MKTRAALTARCGETARRGLVAFLEYGSALEWLIGAGKRDPLAQAAQRLGSPRQEAHRGAGGRNCSKWFDTTLGDPCDGPSVAYVSFRQLRTFRHTQGYVREVPIGPRVCSAREQTDVPFTKLPAAKAFLQWSWCGRRRED